MTRKNSGEEEGGDRIKPVNNREFDILWRPETEGKSKRIVNG